MENLKKFKKDLSAIQKAISSKAYLEFVVTKLSKVLEEKPKLDKDEFKFALEKIFPEQYKKFYNETLKRYDDILEIVNKYYKDLGDEITRDHSKIKSLELIHSTNLGQFEEQAKKKIIKKVNEAIDEKAAYDELVDKLRTVSTGVSYYSNTLAHTQLRAYGRNCKSEKALLAEVFYFEYVGRIREYTYSHCRKWLAQGHFHIDEIAKLDNGAKQPKPVMVYCGGWNCHHDFEPDPFHKGNK